MASMSIIFIIFLTTLLFPSVTTATTTPLPTAYFSATPSDASSCSLPDDSMKVMIEDAISKLSAAGYRSVASALSANYLELSELKFVTIFAMADESIVSDEGRKYLSSFRTHVVPDRRMRVHEMVTLLQNTKLTTMEQGEKLVVTTGGRKDVKAKVKFNFVEIDVIDLLHNDRVVVHGIKAPFPHIHPCVHHVDDHNHGSFVGNYRVESWCERYDQSRGVCMVESDQGLLEGHGVV